MRWLNQHPHQLVETSEHCSVPPLKYGGSPIKRSSKRPSYARPRARRGAIRQKSGPGLRCQCSWNIMLSGGSPLDLRVDLC